MTSHSRAERAADARPPETPAIGKPTLCMINYNGEAISALTRCDRLSRRRDRFAEVVVIDEASEDGSLEIGRREFPMVRIVRLPENRGPAAARKHGLACVELRIWSCSSTMT